jgi:hypothetical protein
MSDNPLHDGTHMISENHECVIQGLHAHTSSDPSVYQRPDPNSHWRHPETNQCVIICSTNGEYVECVDVGHKPKTARTVFETHWPSNHGFAIDHDPTHGRVDRDIQWHVQALLGPNQGVAERVAIENTLQTKRDKGQGVYLVPPTEIPEIFQEEKKFNAALTEEDDRAEREMTLPMVIGIAQEEIVAGQMVELDPSTGTIRVHRMDNHEERDGRISRHDHALEEECAAPCKFFFHKEVSKLLRMIGHVPEVTEWDQGINAQVEVVRSHLYASPWEDAPQTENPRSEPMTQNEDQEDEEDEITVGRYVKLFKRAWAEANRRNLEGHRTDFALTKVFEKMMKDEAPGSKSAANILVMARTLTLLRTIDEFVDGDYVAPGIINVANRLKSILRDTGVSFENRGDEVSPSSEERTVEEPVGLPQVGDVWLWEPEKPHAREVVTVTATQQNSIGTWKVESSSRSGTHWNDLSRWVEATVLVTPAEENNREASPSGQIDSHKEDTRTVEEVLDEWSTVVRHGGNSVDAILREDIPEFLAALPKNENSGEQSGHPFSEEEDTDTEEDTAGTEHSHQGEHTASVNYVVLALRTDPLTIGREVLKALNTYEKNSGRKRRN